MNRVVAEGKHLALDGRPFRVRGCTYGSFLPRVDGEPFPETTQISLDMVAMQAAGMNTVRTYSVPPPELLDIAGELGIRVIVGLHYRDWRDEVTPGRAARRRVWDAGRAAVDAAMARCAGSPAVLAVAVGNEVPSDVVRVHGIGPVQETLSRLADEVHAADADALATYCNFPTTEYLHLEGLDLACFNVFLEEEDKLRAYLRHLQVVTGEVPLVISELGLPSDVHGVEAQAESLRWQLRVVDETGCAGATVFSWTDEWGVAGESVEGWGFGITDARRRPKPALDVVSAWARSSLRGVRDRWPKVTVVVCAYNEERTIEECLRSLQACEYPSLEVIVCDDGSRDATLEKARQFDFRVLPLPHGGLSAARNAGLAAASGEIVAYLDADAMCHPEWPYHLALSLEEPNVAATGGPNLPVPGAGPVEQAVAASPGSPMHVLVADDRAEHVPGCNMAFWRTALEEIGGFDVAYTSAGDDVDVCWKLLDRGREIGFSAAAQVTHHRRSTVRGYLRQQRGYGRAERLLTPNHPHRFNRLGQARWRGFIYGANGGLRSLLRPVVYHGYLGTSPFQPVAQRPAEMALAQVSPFVPVAVFVGLAAAVLGMFAPVWLIVAGAVGLLLALYGTVSARGADVHHADSAGIRLRALVGFLHLAQPVVRLWGRLTTRPEHRSVAAGRPWTGDRLGWLEGLRQELDLYPCSVRVGGAYDEWDLQVAVGPTVAYRIAAAVVWQWTPQYRLRVRLRFPALVAATAGAALALFAPGLGLWVIGAVAVWTIAEAVVLRAVVGRTLRASVRGTQASPGRSRDEFREAS